jgi:hypothetical protein
MMHNTSKMPRRAGGQAMVEFLVAALFFLVPLFLAVVVIGKFGDVQNSANQAARYAAWERTVWYDDAGSNFGNINDSNHKTAVQISNEISARLINDRSLNVTTIKNTDKNATTFVNGIDPMWRDNAGDKYLTKYDQHSTTVTKTSPKTNVADGAIALIEKLPLPQGVVGTLVPPVPNDTLAIATVTFKKMAETSSAYRRLWPKDTVWGVDWEGVDFSASGGILSNTWAANSSQGTKGMVAMSVPTAQGLGKVLTVTTLAMEVWDPTLFIPAGPLQRLEIGKIAPDVVPPDRLK